MGRRAVNLLRNMAVPELRNSSNPTSGYVGTVAAAASSTTTLTAADSGKVVLMAPNAAAVVLPAAVSGMRYTVVLTSDYATATCTVTAAAGEFMAGGVASGDSSDGNLADGSSDLIATFGTDTLAGDRLDLVSDGSLWFVSGFMADGTADGIAFSS